jgi:hypothetical protein
VRKVAAEMGIPMDLQLLFKSRTTLPSSIRPSGSLPPRPHGSGDANVVPCGSVAKTPCHAGDRSQDVHDVACVDENERRSSPSSCDVLRRIEARTLAAANHPPTCTTRLGIVGPGRGLTGTQSGYMARRCGRRNHTCGRPADIQITVTMH